MPFPPCDALNLHHRKKASLLADALLTRSQKRPGGQNDKREKKQKRDVNKATTQTITAALKQQTEYEMRAEQIKM